MESGTRATKPAGTVDASAEGCDCCSHSTKSKISEHDLAIAREVFKTAVNVKILVVSLKGSKPCTETFVLLSKYSGDLKSFEINEHTASEVFRVTGWDSLPLIFIKGDCIGGYTQLCALDQRSILKGWLEDHTYDLIVIGGGSGGLAAAKEAASLGKKVACLDFVKPSVQGSTWGLGGTCVNVGCIPKKLMHRASILGEHISDAKKFGWQIPEGDITMDWVKLKNAVQEHIGSLNWGYRVQLREKSVQYFNSYGRFIDTHTIQAEDKKGRIKTLTADRFLIATGLRPKYPDIIGAKECCISSDDLFSLPYNPGKTLCVGASYISLESAGFLRAIGNDVTVMVRSILLRAFDQDMAERIRQQMLDMGVKFLSGVPFKYEKLEEPHDNKPGLIRVYNIETLPDGSKRESYENYNTVLMAIGRYAVTDNIGLDKLGVELAPSKKIIGRHEQSISCPYIYAIGDVLEGHPELTPVARTAGKTLMKRLYTGNCELTEYDKIPTTVFTPLEYGCCGLSEEAAVERYGEDNINVYHAKFIPLEFTVPQRIDTKHCYLKLICLKTDKDRVLGFHILTPDAGEITQGFAIALKLNATKTDFDRLIGIHPTVAENFTTLVTLKQKGGEELKASGC